MPTPSVINQYRYPDAINRRYWDTPKYFLENFVLQPISAKVGGGAATGTAGDNNVLYTQFNAFQWYVIGTQTILAPSLDTFGLNLVQDQTSGDGMELNMGVNSLTPAAFIIGTDRAFFFRMTFSVEDASGCNPLTIGFRKAQAFDATLANYTDFAQIGIVGTSGDIQTQTQLASGGVVLTDTTQNWADGEVHTLKVLVSATGVVTYQVDEQAPTVVAAYTFANGLTVVPYVRFTQSADVTTRASTNYFEVGYQS